MQVISLSVRVRTTRRLVYFTAITILLGDRNTVHRPICRGGMRAHNGHVDGYAEFIKY